MRKLINKIAIAATVMAPATALAQSEPGDLPTPVENWSQLLSTIQTIANVMFGLLMGLGVVFVLYAAFLFLISRGDTDKVKNARSALTYAIAAILIGVLAGGISLLVRDLVI